MSKLSKYFVSNMPSETGILYLAPLFMDFIHFKCNYLSQNADDKLIFRKIDFCTTTYIHNLTSLAAS